MILLIDNYDSFVQNLARYFRRLGCETVTLRNDAVDAARVRELAPEAIVISPGPGTPHNSGYSLGAVNDFHQSIPMLGVCLGHQAIIESLGGVVSPSGVPMHGRASELRHDGSGLFAGLPPRFNVGRYHSLVGVKKTIPDSLVVTATLDDGTVMAVQHRSYPVVGVQFHPESVLTQFGYQILMNFMAMAGMEVPETVPEDGF